MISFLILACGVCVIPLFSLFPVRKGFFAFFALFLLTAAFFINFVLQDDLGYVSRIFFFDDLGRFFNSLFLFISIMVGVFAADRVKNRELVFYTMLLAGTSAMMIIASSKNLIGVFIGLELLSLSFYELCALRKDGGGLEATAKLFFMSVFSSIFFIAGAVLVYNESHTFDIKMFLTFSHSPLFITGLAFILGGLSFKMSIFPFNIWLPDVYQGAPSEVTALLSGSSKKAGFAAFIRLLPPFFAKSPGAALGASAFIFFSVLAWLSVLTMSFGNILASIQTNAKRMIAYSIIAHAGFLVMGLAAGNPLGYLGLLFHILIHALMATGVFLIIAFLEQESIVELDDYNGLGKRAPLVSSFLTLFLLSLTGIPPLAGFISKFILWSGAVQAGFMWLAVAAIINSALSTYYYFLILRRIWGFPAVGISPIPALTGNQLFAIGVPAFLIVLLGVYPNPALQYLGHVIELTIRF